VLDGWEGRMPAKILKDFAWEARMNVAVDMHSREILCQGGNSTEIVHYRILWKAFVVKVFITTWRVSNRRITVDCSGFHNNMEILYYRIFRNVHVSRC
jgi:hypothetical protein